MKLKVFLVIFSILLICSFGVTVSSCGLLDDDEGTKIDCNRICKKEKECDEEMTEEDLQNCLNGCKKAADSDYLLDSFEKAINDCYGKSCSEIESCIDKSSSLCKVPDFMPYVNATCEKMIECGTEVTKEECVTKKKEGFEREIKDGGWIRCFTDKVFSDIADCIKKTSCDIFYDDIDKCMVETIGYCCPK